MVINLRGFLIGNAQDAQELTQRIIQAVKRRD